MLFDLDFLNSLIYQDEIINGVGLCKQFLDINEKISFKKDSDKFQVLKLINEGLKRYPNESYFMLGIIRIFLSQMSSFDNKFNHPNSELCDISIKSERIWVNLILILEDIVKNRYKFYKIWFEQK